MNQAKERCVDTYYIDGEFIREDHANISVKDIIVLRGYGVFDFMITYNKRPFHMQDHVARLKNSAAEIGLELRHSSSDICDIINQTIQQNPHHRESNVRVVYTGGISPDGVTPQGNGILMVMVTPKYEMPESWYENGAAIMTIDMERFMPAAKSTNYLTAVFAQQEAKKKECIEAVYVDKQNRLLEGTTTNIFAVKNDIVITPPNLILPGITREVVIGLVKKRYKLELRHIHLDELKDVNEIFLTASSKEIVPIVKIDDIAISSSRPGKQTREIMRLFREYTDAYGRGELS